MGNSPAASSLSGFPRLCLWTLLGVLNHGCALESLGINLKKDTDARAPPACGGSALIGLGQGINIFKSPMGASKVDDPVSGFRDLFMAQFYSFLSS